MRSKKDYILDVCCIRHAAELVNYQDQPCFKALTVFSFIMSHCDRIVANSELLKKYKNHIPKLREKDPSAADQFTRFLKRIFSTQDKLKEWYYDLFPLPNEPERSKEDKHLIRLAARSNATLITANHTLIQDLDLNEEGISRRCGIRVLNLDQAIREIAKPFQNN